MATCKTFQVGKVIYNGSMLLCFFQWHKPSYQHRNLAGWATDFVHFNFPVFNHTESFQQVKEKMSAKFLELFSNVITSITNKHSFAV